MKDERRPIEPADEEELRSAAALARALEGGADEPDVPQAALETAALLRLSAGGAELAPERRDAIKNELLAGMAARRPAESERRRRTRPSDWLHGLPRWLLLGLPLGGTAALCLVLLARGPEPDASFAARSMEPSGARSRVAQDELADEAAEDKGAENASAQNGSELQLQAAARLAPPASTPRATEADSYAVPPSEALADDARSPARDKRAVGSGAVGSGAVGWGAVAESSAAADSSTPADPSSGGSRRARDGLASPAQREAGRYERVARSSQERPTGNVAPPPLEQNARAALVGLDKDVRAERSELLARSNDAELSRAHAELDAARSRPELERVRARLTGLLDTAAEGLDPSDARQVRQDVYCRLAETALRLGEPRTALEWTRRGIDLDGPPSRFLAQLMALAGDAFAALGEPSSAASSYMKALRVQEALLDESLDGE